MMAGMTVPSMSLCIGHLTGVTAGMIAIGMMVTTLLTMIGTTILQTKMIVQPTVRFFLKGITMVLDVVAIGRAGLSSPVLPRVGRFAHQLFEEAWTGVVWGQFFGRATKHGSIRAHIVLRFQHHRNVYSQQHQCERGWNGSKTKSRSKSKSRSQSQQCNFPLSVFRFVILTMMTTLWLQERLPIACTECLVKWFLPFLVKSGVVFAELYRSSILFLVKKSGVVFVALCRSIVFLVKRSGDVFAALCRFIVFLVKRSGVVFAALCRFIVFLVKRSGVVFAELCSFIVFPVKKSGEAKRTANNVTDDEEDEAITVFLAKKSGEAKRTANNVTDEEEEDAETEEEVAKKAKKEAADKAAKKIALEQQRFREVERVLHIDWKKQPLLVLGITAEATATVTRQHYRNKLSLVHPDKHSTSAGHPRATEASQNLQNAYDAVKNLTPEERREKYDSTQSSGNASSRPAGASASRNGNGAQQRPSGANYSGSTGNNSSRGKAKEPQQETPFARSSCNRNNCRRPAGTYSSSSDRGGTKAKTTPAKKAKPTKRPKPSQSPPTMPNAAARAILFLVKMSGIVLMELGRSIVVLVMWFIFFLVKSGIGFARLCRSIFFLVQWSILFRAVFAGVRRFSFFLAKGFLRTVDTMIVTFCAIVTKICAWVQSLWVRRPRQQEEMTDKSRAKARKQQCVNPYEQPPLAAEVSDDDSFVDNRTDPFEIVDDDDDGLDVGPPASSDAAVATMAHHQSRLQQNRSGRRTRLPAPEHRRHTRGVIDDDSVLGSAYVDGRRQSRRCLGLKPLGTIRLECGTRRSARIRAGRNS